MEEIKEDNNCIVKAFENNPISIIQEEDNNKKIYYFKASDIGKALDLANIRVSIQNYEDDEQVVRKAYDLRGCEQDTVFLSSQGVYRLLYNSKKPLAKKFRKWAGAILDDIIFNESNELKRQIEEKQKLIEEKEEILMEQQQEIEKIQSELNEKDEIFQVKSKIDKHNFLIEKFSYKKCIYVMEIENDKIKIGSTNDINMRKNNLKDVFGSCLFLDVFECKYYREVEQNILVVLRKQLFKGKINNHISKEIIQLSDQFNYAQFIRIVKDEIKKYTKYMDDIEMKKLEIETNLEAKRLHIEEKRLEIQKMLIEKSKSTEEFLNAFNKIQEIELPNELPNEQINNQKIQQQEEVQQNVMISGSRGRKIQEIDPENLNVIKRVYTSMIYLLRENHGYVKQAIQNAIKTNRIYKGSRWLFVEHNEDPNIVNNIKPTVKSNQPENKYILKLNKEKTQIIEFFTGITQIRTKYKIGDSKITRILNNNIIFDNGYFLRITECSEELLKNFKIPEFKSKKAKSIKQININTNEEIIYKSINEMYVKTGITYKKIAKIIKNKEIVQESKWKYI